MPRVSVIVVTWNASDVLPRCLDSVQAQRVAGGVETIVVDNASTDGTESVLSRYTDRVRVIANRTNAGYAEANNQAAREAEGEILLFLNPDTELLGSDLLERLTGVLGDRRVGLAGPMLVNADGSLQPSCAADPSVGLSLLVGSGLHRLVPNDLLARVGPQFWSHDRPLDADWLMGAALAVRADVFRELGGFWGVMYAEDQDLAYRARRRGLRVRFEPSVKVVHLGNHSGSKRWSSAERAERTAAADLEFLRAHYSRPRAIVIRAIVCAAYASRWLAHSLLGRRERASVFRSMARVYAAGRYPRRWDDDGA